MWRAHTHTPLFIFIFLFNSTSGSSEDGVVLMFFFFILFFILLYMECLEIVWVLDAEKNVSLIFTSLDGGRREGGRVCWCMIVLTKGYVMERDSPVVFGCVCSPLSLTNTHTHTTHIHTHTHST